MTSYYRHIAIITLGSLSILGYGVQAQSAPQAPTESFSLNAAGATFPFPLIDLWRVEYAKEYPNVSLNYQSIGSGGGIKQHIEHTVNFAASDTPMRISEAELAADTLHIPESIGAIVVAYNIPEIQQSGLQLDGDTIVKIYLGEITMWNDEQIRSQNPDKTLPDAEIISAHRSDGSGTTFVFTDYLSTVSDQFEQDVGVGKSVPWPGGIAAAGNEGVAKIILSTQYSIGYVELAYAYQTGMTFAHVQNGDKTAYIEPTIDTVRAASSNISASLPAAHDVWQGVRMVSAPGPNSYPISSLTYILVYGELDGVTDSYAEAGTIVHLIHWMLTKGQQYSESLLYVPIPDEISQIGIEGLKSITYNGAPVWGSGLDSDPIISDDPVTVRPDDAGGCLVATSVYGTELSEQVQTLREIRESALLTTVSGTAFMGAFNELYYSFSPSVADILTQSPELRSVTRALITPMLSTLSIMSYADGGSESSVLGLGSLVIALNVSLYVGIPVTVASLVWRKLGRRGVLNC